MKNLNSKGFGIIEGLLIFVIVGLIGGAGYYVYNANRNNKGNNDNSGVITQKKEETDKKQIPKNWTKFDKDSVKFYYPSSWSELGSQQKSEDFAFSDSLTTRSIEVYTSQPRLYYSSNAPFICQLESSKWVDYQVNTPPDSLSSSSSGYCSDVSMDTVGGNIVYSIAGGAMGKDKYVKAVRVADFYVVISDFRDVDSASDGPGISGELRSSLDTFVKEFTEVN